MSDTAAEIQWYIARDGKQHGPLSEAEMQLFVKSNYLKPTDLLWKAGFDDWKPALSIFPPGGNQSAPAPAAPPKNAPADDVVKSKADAGTTTIDEKNPSKPAANKVDTKPDDATVNLSSRSPASSKQAPEAGSSRAPLPGRAAARQHPAPTGAQPSASPHAPLFGPTHAAGPSLNRPNVGNPNAPVAPATQPSPASPNSPTGGTGQPLGNRAPGATAPGQHPTAPNPQARPQQPAARGPAPMPNQGQTGSNRPIGYGQPRRSLGPNPQSATAPLADEPTFTNAPAKKGMSAVQVLVAAAAFVFVGGAAYFGYTYSEQLRDVAQSFTASMTDETKTSKPPVVASKKDTKTAATAPIPTPASPTPAAPQTTPNTTNTTNTSIDILDAQFQKSTLWALLKSEYPEWYAARLQQAAKLSANNSNTDVTKKLLTEIVALRRKHADSALAATPGKLEGIAQAFLANLKRLSEHSTEACYTFISKGELSPQVIDLMTAKSYGPTFEGQATRIFEAISEGRKSPIKRGRAHKEDYNVLARQLGTMGWTQQDLQLFANPKALAGAPPARVCKLVQDWFAAHIALSDAAVKDRLLFETLRPVVAG